MVDNKVGLVPNPNSVKASKKSHYKQQARGTIDDHYKITIKNSNSEFFELAINDGFSGAPIIQTIQKPSKHELVLLVHFDAQRDEKAGHSKGVGSASMAILQKASACASIRDLINNEWIAKKDRNKGGLLVKDAMNSLSADKHDREREVIGFVEECHKKIQLVDSNIDESGSSKTIENQLKAYIKTLTEQEVSNMLPCRQQTSQHSWHQQPQHSPSFPSSLSASSLPFPTAQMSFGMPFNSFIPQTQVDPMFIQQQFHSLNQQMMGMSQQMLGMGSQILELQQAVKHIVAGAEATQEKIHFSDDDDLGESD